MPKPSMNTHHRALWLPIILMALVGGFAALWASGWLPLARSGDSQAVAAGIWTCSMHPQIRLDHPGKCPICGMDLIPVQQASQAASTLATDHLTLSDHARRMATVEAVAIGPRPLNKEIRTVGKVAFDETRMAQISARVNGRVDEVFASFPGTVVKQGDHLVSIYSPELYSTQEEYLIASRRDAEAQRRGGGANGLSLTDNARRRLQLWGVTDQQIQELARSGQTQTHLTVYAPIGGTVVEKNVRKGQYVKEGDVLFSIADLGHVWLILEIYEGDLSWVRFGQPVEVTLEGRPDRVLVGSVGFIEPVLNEQTRAVQVRVILKNDEGFLRPGMYAQAHIRVPILPDGAPAPTGLEGRFACPMHPYVVADTPGDCGVCGMALERVPGQPPKPGSNAPEVLAVPSSAVLTTGQRLLVYVEREPGQYEAVSPKLGPRAGAYYPVLSGLEAGQRVVVDGNFLLDSQFQILGKPSLLYPAGTVGGGAGHSGHAVAPSGGARPSAAPAAEQPKSAPPDPHAAHRAGASEDHESKKRP